MDSDSRRYLRYLNSERDAGRLYRQLAQLTEGDRAEALTELADIEDRHAAHWEAKLRDAGQPIPVDSGRLDPRSSALVEQARRSSLGAVLPQLEAAELQAQGDYTDEPDALPGMAAEERQHAVVLHDLQDGVGGPAVGADDAKDEVMSDEQSVASVAPTKARQPSSGRTTAEVRESLNKAEPWHRTDKSGSLRAAVFGVSDGLVSNTALVMGFAGSGIASSTVRFAGLAGLLAGAFSMAAGEFVSVSSQRDMFRREIAVEAQELREKPQEEQRELELLYRAKGLDRETAHTVAERIMENPKTALDTLAREELGLDPDELGSPVRVAASSFVAFAVGATVPVLPYFFLVEMKAMIVAVFLAVIALAVVGGVVGWLSGAGVVKSALRQLVVGGGAAAVTYFVGKVIGVSVG